MIRPDRIGMNKNVSSPVGLSFLDHEIVGRMEEKIRDRQSVIRKIRSVDRRFRRAEKQYVSAVKILTKYSTLS